MCHHNSAVLPRRHPGRKPGCRGCVSTARRTTWAWPSTWRRSPSSRCTINFCSEPVGADRGCTSPGARPTAHSPRPRGRPSDSLDHDDALYLLDHFFMAHSRRDDPATPVQSGALPSAVRLGAEHQHGTALGRFRLPRPPRPPGSAPT